MRLYKTALPITRGYHTASGGLVSSCFYHPLSRWHDFGFLKVHRVSRSHNQGSSLFKRSGVSGGVRAMSTYSAESSHDYVIVGAGSAGELIRYICIWSWTSMFCTASIFWYWKQPYVALSRCMIDLSPSHPVSLGCVLANRLSEDSANSVLSLEAGPKDTLLGSK